MTSISVGDSPLQFSLIQGADVAGVIAATGDDVDASRIDTRRNFVTVRNLSISGVIKPLLAGTYPLSELGRAQDDFKKKNFIGKLVIKVD